MTFVVEEFKDSPCSTESSYDWSAVCVARGEEVEFSCVGESEENPIVDTVDDNSLEGH